MCCFEQRGWWRWHPLHGPDGRVFFFFFLVVEEMIISAPPFCCEKGFARFVRYLFSLPYVWARFLSRWCLHREMSNSSLLWSGVFWGCPVLFWGRGQRAPATAAAAAGAGVVLRALRLLFSLDVFLSVSWLLSDVCPCGEHRASGRS